MISLFLKKEATNGDCCIYMDIDIYKNNQKPNHKPLNFKIMKTKMNLIFTGIILVLLTSCATTSYYQVYTAAPSNKMTNMDNKLVYEDDNCTVSYNFWDEGGNIGFRFQNKTDQNIYLNLEESFFVHNGIAYDYFKNRVFTETKSSGATTSKFSISTKVNSGLVASSGYSTAYNEDNIIRIPPMTAKIITEYNITESLYRDCDLFKYPTKKQITAKSFSKSDSPIVFSNRIAYKVGQSGNQIQFENEFYVAEISNYPGSELIESKYDEFCEQKSVIKTEYFKDASPAKFYIKYTKGQDTWKH